MMPLTIKPVTTIAECRQLEMLQYQIWGGDPIDVVPDHIMITFVKNQGLALLAQEDNRPIGFCYSFLATTENGQLKHCSHQAGVLPNIQANGVGYQLKLAQRQTILERGIKLISWTFDPMMGLNANLNIGKLGAISNIYHEKLYGEMRTDINAGLVSDRLEVSWRLASPHVQTKLTNQESPLTFDVKAVVNLATRNEMGYLNPPTNTKPFDGPIHYILLPDHIQQMKQADLPLALAWQDQIRTLFQTAFSQGYMVADFIWQRDQQRGYYLLTKETPYYEN